MSQPADFFASFLRDFLPSAPAPYVCLGCMRTELEPGVKLRQCAKCGRPRYCSKECQTKDWPEHKLDCSRADSGPKISQRLIQNLTSSPLFKIIIQACLTLEFNLLNDENTIGVDTPISAIVDLAVEPAEIGDLERIWHNHNVGRMRKIHGMLQITRFAPAQGMTAPALALWKKERLRADLTGYDGDPLVVLHVIYTASNQMATTTMVVPQPTREMVKSCIDSGNISIVPEVVFSTLKPTIDGFIECMNLDIRDDTENKLRLRTRVRSQDIQVISDTASRVETNAAVAFSCKLAREAIYQRPS
ncbi:hypothetical protein R3P38DRAFT_2614536 [Favolaschia claudopus]|uniref:MYND-type domain-containing protein n=1 Tax=Favolaschia claudopus TaxID=2862362 RepID=A0AAW0CN67_9AGAR